MSIVIHEPLTVLVIEDNCDDERLVLRALRSCGLPLFVRVARDGELGLRALGLGGSSEDLEIAVPDMVLSDLKMPKINGDEVLRRVRADGRLREVPYVVFSSSSEPSDVERCLALGASEYAIKPVDYREYIECAIAIARRWLPEERTRRRSFCTVESPIPKPPIQEEVF